MKVKLILPVTLLFLLAYSANAQNYHNETSKKYAASPKSKRKVHERVFQDHLFKFNLSGLLVKSMGGQYEHRVSKKTTLALGLIYRPKSSWFLSHFYDTTTAVTGLSQETKSMYASSTYRTFMVTPEFRYFLGRQAPHGLYLSAFLRAKMDRMDFQYSYYDNAITEQHGVASLNETMMGGGIMLGYQLISKKHWTVDFWFLGPWIGNQHVNLVSHVNAANIGEAQQNIISEHIKPLLVKDVNIEWNNQGISTKFNYFDYSARLIGINIGYNF